MSEPRANDRPRPHWLLLTPTEFLERYHADTGSGMPRNGNKKTLPAYAYRSAIVLNIYIFSDNGLLMFNAQNDSTLMLVTPQVKLTTDYDGRSLRDTALNMVRRAVRSGCLQDIQFVDFSQDQPLILDQRIVPLEESGPDGWEEYRPMEIAILLSSSNSQPPKEKVATSTTSKPHPPNEKEANPTTSRPQPQKEEDAFFSTFSEPQSPNEKDANSTSSRSQPRTEKDANSTSSKPQPPEKEDQNFVPIGLQGPDSPKYAPALMIRPAKWREDIDQLDDHLTDPVSRYVLERLFKHYSRCAKAKVHGQMDEDKPKLHALASNGLEAALLSKKYANDNLPRPFHGLVSYCATDWEAGLCLLFMNPTDWAEKWKRDADDFSHGFGSKRFEYTVIGDFLDDTVRLAGMIPHIEPDLQNMESRWMWDHEKAPTYETMLCEKRNGRLKIRDLLADETTLFDIKTRISMEMRRAPVSDEEPEE